MGRGVAGRTKRNLAVYVLHPASYGTENKCFFFPAICCGKENFFMKKKREIGLFGTVRAMTMAAMLTAMSLVIGIFCKNFLDFGIGLFRITFESLPIILSGIMFGPIVGGIVGASTDIISYFLSKQAYPLNLIVTLGASSMGILSGIFGRYVFRKKGYLKMIFPTLIAHVVGSMIIKSIGLFTFYSWAVLWRIPLYIGIASFEIMLLCLMYRNKTVRRLIDGGFKNEI